MRFERKLIVIRVIGMELSCVLWKSRFDIKLQLSTQLFLTF